MGPIYCYLDRLKSHTDKGFLLVRLKLGIYSFIKTMTAVERGVHGGRPSSLALSALQGTKRTPGVCEGWAGRLIESHLAITHSQLCNVTLQLNWDIDNKMLLVLEEKYH